MRLNITGGVGKTRLAIAVASMLVERFPNGVWFVRLAPLSDSRLVIPTVAATLGVTEQLGTPILDVLLSHLGERQLLLVLDNCEHVTDAASDIDALSDRCQPCTATAASKFPKREIEVLRLVEADSGPNVRRHQGRGQGTFPTLPSPLVPSP